MSRYLITGATGYVGSMLLNRILEEGNETDVIVRNADRLSYKNIATIKIITADITDKKAVARISEKYDYIVHCAAPTRSAYMISNPVEVIQSIVNGTDHVLNLAYRCDVKSMVYLSSMEVYGQIECPEGRRVTENNLGYIDVTKVRSCYPIAKIMAENLCHSYCKEYGVPVKIARLAQTFGRGIRPDENRIFAQFARAVCTGSDLVLHTEGNSMGNYCDIDDVVEAVLFILKRGKNAEAYNVVNEENTMSIRDMAELVAERIAKGNIRVVYDVQSESVSGYPSDTGLRMSGEKLRRLGWEARYDLEEMYRKMIDEISNQYK